MDKTPLALYQKQITPDRHAVSRHDMNDERQFDFWYAVNNTEVLVLPRQRLETFGNTRIDYHLVTELMDDTGKVRVREGSVQAYRPAILTPDSIAETLLEGFQESQARDYIQWLRNHEEDLVILQYGFRIKKETRSEHLLTDTLGAVIERVRQDLRNHDNPLAALVVGVEEPWEVCLIKLLVEMIQASAPDNARQLKTDPLGIRREIESQFRAASQNPALIARLAQTLQRHRLFEEYQDRFFALVRSSAP